MARRKRNEPSVEGFIIMAVVLGFVWFKVSGATWGSVFSLLFWVLVVLVLLVVIVWFVKGLIKDSTPKDLNFSDSESEHLPSSRSSRVTKPEEELEWSEELIHKIEWRVFEKLCIGLWRAKGFDVEETGSGADGGVDFYLRAKETKKRIGAIQCKSWKSKQVDVKTVRELQGVIASENLQLGLLMYAGVLSKPAKEFIDKPSVTVKEQGVNEIYKQVRSLSAQNQSELLSEITSGDYLTPSCPNCDVKMVERTTKKTGNKFLGCPNFPKCRHIARG